MRSKNVKICKQLLIKFGHEYHIDKIREECLELALAITHFKSDTKLNKKIRLENILKEFADVKIALRQGEEIFNRNKINKFVNLKLQKKQKKHLYNERYNREISRKSSITSAGKKKNTKRGNIK